MTPTRKWTLGGLAAALLLVAIAGLRFSPGPRGYDTALVDPNLIGLQEPFQRVLSSYEVTRNTIGIEILDATGRREQFALPGRANGLASYTRVLVGESWREEQAEVAHPDDTKLMLIEILAKNPSPMNDRCAALLRRSTKDLPRIIWWRWKLL